MVTVARALIYGVNVAVKIAWCIESIVLPSSTTTGPTRSRYRWDDFSQQYRLFEKRAPFSWAHDPYEVESPFSTVRTISWLPSWIGK